MKTVRIFQILTAVAVVISACSKSSGNELPEPGPSSEDDSLAVYTLASFNVKCDNGATGDQSWPYCRKYLVDTLLRQRSFDVCGLCEISQASIRADIQELLGDIYSFTICGREDGRNTGEAVGIAYKKDMFELVDSGYFFLNSHPETSGEATEWYSPEPEKPYGRSRIALWNILEDKTLKTRFVFIISHFELNEGMREGSAKLIVKKAKEFVAAGYPVFFCGDLNALPDEDNSIGALSNYFNDSYDYAVRAKLPREGMVTTYNKFNAFVGKQSGKRIDYMFYRGSNVVLKKYGVVYDLINGKLPSDHYPVYVNVSFRKEETD